MACKRSRVRISYSPRNRRLSGAAFFVHIRIGWRQNRSPWRTNSGFSVRTLGELQEIVAEKGMPRFAAKQIATWLYRKGVDSIDRMTDLSLKNREALRQEFQVGRLPYAAVEESSDGTKKYLFPTLGGRYIESAYIPDADRATLCVSSQSGCKMGCKFCMTARQGFAHHLTTGEILNQICSIPERERLTNLVYMGMASRSTTWIRCCVRWTF